MAKCFVKVKPEPVSADAYEMLVPPVAIVLVVEPLPTILL